MRATIYRRRTTYYFNKKSKHWELKFGGLVLKEIGTSTRRQEDAKLKLSWEGPYTLSYETIDRARINWKA